MIERSETDPRGYKGVLAESYDITPDKSAYIFHLRKGVKFSDGTPFNAKAAKYNWDKVLAVSDTRQYCDDIESFEVIDDYTIRANIIPGKWNNLILEDFRNEIMMVLSPTSYEQNGEDWSNTNPIGTGPWLLSDYQRAQKHVFERNPDYWNQPYPYLDSFEFILMKDRTVASMAYQAGEVEMFWSGNAPTAAELIKAGYEMYPTPVGGVFSLACNQKDPESAWSDIRMRQALEYAIPKQKIADGVGEGILTASYECMRGTRGLGADYPIREYDPEKAKQLMAEAGYPDGLTAELVVYTKFNGDQIVAVQGALAEVGIDININVVTGPQWTEMQLTPAEGNGLYWERGKGAPSPRVQLNYAKEEYHSSSSNLPGAIRPPGFDELIEQASLEENPEKLREMLIEMGTMLYENSFNIPVIHWPTMQFVSPDVKWDKNLRPSFYTHAGNNQPHFELIWLDR
ncbi:ABC transporter substrate-binding protein [Chloroflexota bacterium]